MKNKKSWVTGGGTLVMAVIYAALSVASPSAGADLLRYYTGFERPAFVLGPLDGQDGWENPSKTAWISPYQPAQGKQAIVVKGAKLVYESDGDFATAVHVDDMTAYHRLGAQIDFKKGEVKWFADGNSVAELPIVDAHGNNMLTGNISRITPFSAGDNPQTELVIGSHALPSAATLQIALAVTPTEARAAISQTNLRAIVVELSNSKYAGREYGTQGDIDTRNYVKGQLKAAGLVTVNGTWQQFFTLNNRSTANVWAQLPGTDATLKSEVIIVSAHHDHLGSNCYGTGTYCPGANDDATGVAAVIELARAVAKVRTLLKKTVVFITFGAEEYGYAGAKYYLAHPPLPLDKTIFMMDFDMLGLNYPNVTTWSPTAKTTRVNLWFNQAFNGVYDDTDSVPWISWEAESCDELDAVVFRQAGIPNRAWWNRDPYNHTTSDTAYRLNYWVMAETVRMIFDFIMKLATDTTARAPAPMY